VLAGLVATIGSLLVRRSAKITVERSVLKESRTDRLSVVAVESKVDDVTERKPAEQEQRSIERAVSDTVKEKKDPQQEPALITLIEPVKQQLWEQLDELSDILKKRDYLALKDLRRPLTSNEVVALRQFVTFKHPTLLQEPDLLVLKNDIMNKIMIQPEQNPKTTVWFVDIVTDREQDDVMRAYAGQFLGLWYRNRENEKERGELLNTMIRTATEEESMAAGTTLLALSGLVQDGVMKDSSAFEVTAMNMINDPHTLRENRIAALQTCARVGFKQALEEAKKAATNAPNIHIKIVGIATVGDLGNVEDLSWLEKLNQNKDGRLTPAIETAKKKIVERSES